MTSKKDSSGDIKINVGLGDLLKGLGNFIDLIQQMEAEGKAKISHIGEITGLDKVKGLKGIYGIDIKIGNEGSPRIKPFGNIRKNEEGLVVEEVVEPIVDVFDESDDILVIAELPGVNEDNFHFQVNGDILVITASRKDRKYRKEILLPVVVDPEGATTIFKNGIIELRLPKTKTSDNG
ncbi:Hsp20/alpha crystallin family protein [Desulfofundulus sp. TPOSR]|uniref:Hsp20/alpha crystallin family protein n=1 Tax=Desulfofundulus sp. TPOSR TaxID=2714340 RepID=UPI00140DB0F9|nr:Hsp20/alpha crystallin family protein [Desulfofundulus sp. TPOSR]NHM26766.1 Hsp20/alpha crystallin family protein [Desulfofundulus sp. TPOSR]